MGRIKTLIPNDFRDFLSIASFLGLLGTWMLFSLGKPLISENIDAIFLVISGAGLMVAGKVFSIPKWAKDGIQKNEVTLVTSIIIGSSAFLIGILLLVGIGLPIGVTSFGGWVALISAGFIFFDYISKNS